MRNLGHLYNLCIQSTVKQTLLVEAVARAFKKICALTLRFFTRKEKLTSLKNEEDAANSFVELEAQTFLDSNETFNTSKQDIVIDLFNLALGFSDSSSKFWNGPMKEVLDSKFGITSSAEELFRTLHFPQLFLAMQYHTGNIFQDELYNDRFRSSEHPSPLSKDDLVEHNSPGIKYHIPFPGAFYDINRMCELFLSSGLYAEAINAFRIRLSAFLTALGSLKCPKVQAAIASNVFKFSTALYLEKQYDTAKSVIFDFLEYNRKYSAISGRMMSLLMCIEFQLGNTEQAMIYFEAAERVFTFVLGHGHSIHCLHAAVLAELYKSHGALYHSKVTILVAHEVSRLVLGKSHLVSTLIGLKIGHVYLEERKYKEASEMFSSVLTNLDSYEKRNIISNNDTAECLFCLAISLFHIGETDNAIHIASRCIQSYCKISPSVVNPRVVSCFVLLGDLYFSKGDPNSALDILTDAWTSIKVRPRDYSDAGSLMVDICCKIFFILHCSNTLAARSLLESVAQEMLIKLENNQLNANVWENSCQSIFESLWDIDARTFLNSLMSTIQKCECIGISQVFKEPDCELIQGIPFYAIKAGLVVKLIQRAETL